MESQNLYVGSKSSFGLQGNMSDLDCEQEDWQKHPKSKSARFQEVMLLPGDLLYIPARTWHYVRSLSTSISVNYWY
jgi:ribosomal protein L16 Arg81 hydroxylase